jgi:hypothetical protein
MNRRRWYQDDSQEVYLGYARQLLSESREELTRADNKAALLLAAVGVVAGALLAAVVAGDWSPFSLAACVAWVWWLGATAAVVGIIFLAAAVYPVTKYRTQRPADFIAYFGDVVSVDGSVLQDRLIKSSQLYDARLIDQISAISGIVDRKYRAIQAGLWFIGAGLGLALASAIADHFI